LQTWNKLFISLLWDPHTGMNFSINVNFSLHVIIIGEGVKLEKRIQAKIAKQKL